MDNLERDDEMLDDLATDGEHVVGGLTFAEGPAPMDRPHLGDLDPPSRRPQRQPKPQLTKEPHVRPPVDPSAFVDRP